MAYSELGGLVIRDAMEFVAEPPPDADGVNVLGLVPINRIQFQGVADDAQGNRNDSKSLSSTFEELCGKHSILAREEIVNARELVRVLESNLVTHLQKEAGHESDAQMSSGVSFRRHDPDVLRAWILEGDVGAQEFWRFVIAESKQLPMKPPQSIQREFQVLAMNQRALQLQKIEAPIEAGEGLSNGQVVNG